MEPESTQFVFNEKGVFISPDIVPVFNFLVDIEKEIESILGFSKKLEGIKENYLEVLNFVSFLSTKLKENHIDFSFTFKEHPEKVAEKLALYLPFRSQMIVLFASLEVLFSLHAAYELKTSDEEVLKQHTMDKDNTKHFLNSFILNESNLYYQTNKARFSKIDSSKLRDLRNSLTHFFSIGKGGLSLAPDQLSEKARKLENLMKQNKQGHVVFISEQDLYGLIKSANILRMRRWSDDFKEDPFVFKEGMVSVINLVKRTAPAIIGNNRLQV